MPLTDSTRRLRRNILFLSVFMGLLGSGIITLGEASFLGLVFDPGSATVMNYLMMGLLGFWVVSFLCYAGIDLMSWDSRGAPRGFFGLILSPMALALEIFLPLAVAGFAMMALKPDVLEHFRPGGMPEIQTAVQDIRDQRIVERAESKVALATRRADLALTRQSAEQMIADALMETQLEAERLSDRELLAGMESSLRARLREEHLGGILDEAQLAEFRQDAPAAVAHYSAALFFLMNDDIDDAQQAVLFEGLNERIDTLLAWNEEPEPAIEDEAPLAGDDENLEEPTPEAAQPIELSAATGDAATPDLNY